MQSKVVLIFGKNVLAGLAPCGGHGAGTFDTLTFLRGMNEQTLGDFPLGLSSPYCALGFEMLFQIKIIHQMTFLMELTKTIRLRLNFNERLSIFWPPKSIQIKAWFSYVGPEYIGRYIGYSRGGLAEIFPIICDRGTGVQKFRRLVMSKIHRRQTLMTPKVQI